MKSTLDKSLCYFYGILSLKSHFSANCLSIILQLLILVMFMSSCASINDALIDLNTASPTAPDPRQNRRFLRHGIKRIVILAPKDKFPKGRDHQVEGIFLKGLIEKGYDVTTRNDLPRVLREWNLSRSGLSKSSSRQFSLLDVDAILVPEITVYEKAFTTDGSQFIKKLHMTTRIIDVKTGDTLWSRTKSYEPNLLNVLIFPYWVAKGGYNKFEALCVSTLKEFPSRI